MLKLQMRGKRRGERGVEMQERKTAAVLGQEPQSCRDQPAAPCLPQGPSRIAGAGTGGTAQDQAFPIQYITE